MPTVPPTPPTRRRRRRAVALALGAALASLALTGCIHITNITIAQDGEIGPALLKITACASNNTAACPNETGGVTNNTGTGQVLIGIQIPSTVTAPTDFKSSFPALQPFTQSPSYTAELQRLQPAPAGSKWVGYISDARTYTPGQVTTVSIPLQRALQADGSPPPSSLVASVVVGSRVAAGTLPANRDVACGTALDTVDTAEFGICADSQGTAATSGGLHEFVFLTPAPVTVRPGQTATIPVTGKFSGAADPAINFALTATTTVPGTAALVNVPTLAPPADSTTAVAVTVPVPAGTKPGTYTVTLTGTLGSGEKRSTTATLVVGGSGSTAGEIALSKLSLSRSVISNRRGKPPAVVSVTVSQPGTLTALLERRLPGRRKNGRCVAPSRSLVQSGAPRCFRFQRTSSLRRKVTSPGVVKLSVSGRTNGSARVPGVYRLTLTGASGGTASVPLRATLVVTS